VPEQEEEEKKTKFNSNTKPYLKIDKKSTPYLLKKSLFLWIGVLPILWLHRLLPLESHKESRIYKKDCNG
jgi:hypothetical protein